LGLQTNQNVQNVKFGKFS